MSCLDNKIKCSNTGLLCFSGHILGSSYLELAKPSKMVTLVDKDSSQPHNCHISAEDFQLGTFISLSTLSHLFLQHTMTLCRRRTRPVPMICTLSKTMLRRRRFASSREVCYDSVLDWLIAVLVIPRVSHAS